MADIAWNRPLFLAFPFVPDQSFLKEIRSQLKAMGAGVGSILLVEDFLPSLVNKGFNGSRKRNGGTEMIAKELLSLRKAIKVEKGEPMIIAGSLGNGHLLLHQEIDKRNPFGLCFLSEHDCADQERFCAILASFINHYAYCYTANGNGYVAREGHESWCINRPLDFETMMPLSLQLNDICPACLRERKDLLGRDPRFQRLTDYLEKQRVFLLNRTALLRNHAEPLLSISGPRYDICFPQLGNARLELTPLEKVTYLLFLRHAEGLHLHEVGNHFEWLIRAYARIASTRSRAQINKHVKMLSDAGDNSISEKISRIRHKLEKLGGKTFAQQYGIRGPRGGIKKINIRPAQLLLDKKSRSLFEGNE